MTAAASSPLRLPPAAELGLPPSAGLGLHREHLDEVLGRAGRLGFIEIHAENFMSEGGPTLALLDQLASQYPISLHGVALSLGGEEPLDPAHLQRLRRIIDRTRPASFSEHLAWASHDGIYFNDLLPIAYDATTLSRVADHVDEAQSALGMRLLLENPSTYVSHAASDWDEIDFLAEIARRTGCGLLLDINNAVVSSVNHGWDPQAYLQRFPLALVGEIHLAGHSETRDDAGQRLLIDSHGEAIAEPVWLHYADVIARAGPLPTLIERDNDIPAFAVVAAEVAQAAAILARHARKAA
ncbi:DUF692 domain-containing protein [Sandarakinorhabdus sp. AAP62]|uniref:MNIO family bufferin maturase n=1 Tax=Sandarakinorhabdus sp. AAP62 TaxID=1248916 RepID=UPI00031726BD|nr:DUF692 domain-containing protein [Sandarakinorhabdus sp. AAP62]